MLVEHIQDLTPKTLSGKTPAMIAAENGHVEVKLFLNSHAKSNKMRKKRQMASEIRKNGCMRKEIVYA